MPPGDTTNDRFVACVQLTHIFARALHNWHNAEKETAKQGEREHFLVSWKRQLDEWRASHGDKGESAWPLRLRR
jgi:hypothetical protein